MARPSIFSGADMIPKKSPRKGGFYLAKRSFEPGRVPDHLRQYAETMGADARACAAASVGLHGNSRVEKMNGCIAEKRSKGGHRTKV